MSPRPDRARRPAGAPSLRGDLPAGALLLLALLLPRGVPLAARLLGAAGPHPLWWIVPWTAAAAAAAVALWLRRRAAAAGPAGGEGRIASAELRLLLLAAAAVHVAGCAPGAPPAAVAAGHATLLLAAASRLPGWGRPAACWAAVAALALAGPQWAPLAPALPVLGLLTAAAWALQRGAHEAQEDLRRELDGLHRLRSEAEGVRAAGGARREPAAEDLSPRAKEARAMSAVVGLDGDLDRILGLARQAVGARGALLFLRKDDPELLPLRRSVVAEGGPAENPAAAIRVGDGVVGHAARTRRPALFTDLAPGSLAPPLYLDGAVSPSLAVVPVWEEGAFRGMLLAEAPAPGAFGRAEEQLLTGFAAEVGALLEAVRADVLEQRRRHRYEGLAHIIQEISSTIRLEDILARMLDLTGELVPHDRSALYLADRGGRRLVLKAQRGFDPPGDAGELSFEHGLPGYIAQHGRAMLFSDLKEGERGVEIVPGAPGQERIRSLVGLPVRDQAGLVGVWVLTADAPRRFGAEDLELLQVLAGQAGVALANAALHEEVERMAVTDGLTGLFNHRHFQERLGGELARAARTGEAVSLLLMDIDHFKKINDTHGHPFGDLVLKALAAELRRLARRIDVVARYGGEEFALVLVATDRRGCRTTAARVLKAVRAIQVPLQGGAFTFTASIGAATCPDDASTREELVRRADQALYAAKAGGRNRVVAAGETGTA